MAKSVLPSTRRKGARDDRRFVHKRERARVRAALRNVAGQREHDDLEDAELHYEDKGAISEMVRDRREADKIASLERWAQRRVIKRRELRDEDWGGRMAIFRRLFPDNTIGRHALGHIAWVIGTRPTYQFPTYLRRFARFSGAGDSLSED